MDDWRLRLSGIFQNLQQLQAPPWLTVPAIVAALVLLLALIIVSARYLRPRRQLAEREQRTEGHFQPNLADTEDAPRGISLEGEGRALVHHILPRRPQHFLLAVAALAAGCWMAGLLLTTNVQGFLGSSEWRLQPFYLATHFITLRLFANAFARYFKAGAVHLDVPPDTVQRATRLVLGPTGALLAVVLSAPFCVYDYRVLFGGAAGGEGLGSAADQLLLGMWWVEWFLMAFIWVMLVGFLLLTRWAIREHRFRAPIEVVLHAKQYRPFLQMSVQGATIVLLFCIANAVYVGYTVAEISDYIGAAITLVLLVVGFVPPWLLLRAKVNRAVNEEMASLRGRLTQAMTRNADAAAGAGPRQSAQDLEARLDEVLVMLRISYLERLYRSLGHTEAMNIFIKLLVPAITMTWYVMRYLKWVS